MAKLYPFCPAPASPIPASPFEFRPRASPAATKNFQGIREIREIRGQILITPMVIKPSNQSKPALSLT
jgi:hypothetical protein